VALSNVPEENRLAEAVCPWLAPAI
jgi:hypothetical protein